MQGQVDSSIAEKATVVIVPRERLTTTSHALVSVIASVPVSVPLIVVDGAYPTEVRTGIDALSKRRPFTSLRYDYYLLPAEARNRALEKVETPYVVFVDNDIEVQQGWLENLVTTAIEQEAQVVTPLTTIRVNRGEGPKEYVHHAGGSIVYMRYKKELTYTSSRRLEWVAPDDPRLDTLPTESDDIEMHTFLAESEILRAAGGFDERLILCDHDDLALRIHALGGRIVFCRKSKACYDATCEIKEDDRAYFAFRWSPAKVALSCDTFTRNWKVGQRFSSEWATAHRRRMLAPFAPAIVRKLPASMFDLYVEFLRRKNRRKPVESGRAALGEPRVCADVPAAVADFYREKLSKRKAKDNFPGLPPALSELVVAQRNLTKAAE